jgi:hypothetical protein
MHLVINERTKLTTSWFKLTASWFNTLATGLVAAGAFAPAAAAFYGLSMPTVGGGQMFAAVVDCLAVGISLHVGGLVLLGKLRE